MRKIMNIIIVGIFVLLCLTGCSTSNADMPYDITQENGDYYLIMKETLDDNSGSTSSEITVAPAITFGSVAEMKHDIQTGNFTEFELEQLSRFTKDEAGRIKICNLDNLYAPQFPATLSEYRVIWDGESYAFFITGTGGQINILSKESFDAEVDSQNDFEKNTKFKILGKSVESDRNATVYTYYDHRSKHQMKRVFYTISGDSGIMYADELYDLTLSDTLPISVRTIGSDNGVYFRVVFSQPKERPSVEWLSQFGLREYVETSIS